MQNASVDPQYLYCGAASQNGVEQNGTRTSIAQQVRWRQRWSGILCHVGLLWCTEAAKASSHVQVLLQGKQTANHSKGFECLARAMVERRSLQEVPASAGSVIQLQLRYIANDIAGSEI